MASAVVAPDLTMGFNTTGMTLSESETRPTAPWSDYESVMRETLTQLVANPVASTVFRRLDQLGHMQRNWDGYGSPPISSAALREAAVFAQAFLTHNALPVPEVVPTPTGGLQFEWHTSHIDLEIEFTPNLAVNLMLEDTETDDDLEYELKYDLTIIPTVLQRLTD